MDFEPWAGQYLHYPWSEGVSITSSPRAGAGKGSLRKASSSAEKTEPPVGFEPTTARLRIESSTTELRWRPPNLAACCSTRYSTSSAGDWVAGAYGWLSDIRAPTPGLSGTRRQPLRSDGSEDVSIPLYFT